MGTMNADSTRCGGNMAGTTDAPFTGLTFLIHITSFPFVAGYYIHFG
jgi:hypothetical protein